MPYGQERPAVLQSVDLDVPSAPVPVNVAGRTHIVYELHLTNFLLVDAAITRIHVKNAETQASIADYRDDAVRRLLGRPGLPREQTSAQTIGPGLRAVAYFWIAVPTGTNPHSHLVHTIELDVRRTSGPVHLAVDGGHATVSTAPMTVLDPPLRGGPWAAIYDPLLVGGHRTAIYAVNGRARIPGRFAIDWIALSPNGTLDNTTSRPADWNGYGAEVMAVADGVVVAAMDDIPDNTSGAVAHPLENASGNYVAIDIGSGRFAFYEHLKRGSVAVKAGDRVKSGQIIGRLGNSGSSSMGPHLHFHLSDANSLLAAEGLPFVFRRFEHLGAFASIDALVGGAQWLATPGSSNPHTLERPGANSVIRFP